YRTDEHDFETIDLVSPDTERDKRIAFQETSSKRIGGEIRGLYQLQPGTYQVVNDILIAPNSVLSLRENTTLEFEHSIGMMVQGELDIRTPFSQPVIFRGIAGGMASNADASSKLAPSWTISASLFPHVS